MLQILLNKKKARFGVFFFKNIWFFQKHCLYLQSETLNLIFILMTQKLNTLLALREKFETSFKNALNDFVRKFDKDQGLFTGERKTYDALEGYADEPTKRKFRKVASTVKEQLTWLEETNTEYLKQLFTIERTNGVGIAKSELVVGGTSWGEFTSTELLRLKGFLENGKLKELYDKLPIRSETTLWDPSTDDIYFGREIYESPMDDGFAKTTLKESYILNDPHPDAKRAPVVAEKTTQVNIGHYTSQDFSGAASMREKAEILARLDLLHKAVVEALEKANDVEVTPSVLGERLFSFLHNGK